MRKTRLKLRERKVRGVLMWEVTVPQRGGGRSRRYFSTKKEAQGFIAVAATEAENFGLAALSVPEGLRVEAATAQRKLKPYGRTITDAVAFYVAHLERVATSRPVEEVIEELLKARAADGLSGRYMKDLRNRLTRFGIDFKGRLIAEITSGEIDSWLRKLGVAPLTRNSFRLRLSVLWEFALLHGWTDTNSLSNVAKAKVMDQPAGILSPEQLARLLEQSSPETVPYWVIGAFAGLRSAELERLEWKDIRFERSLIEVGAAKAKTRARRFVTIQPALRAWLAPYMKERHQGKVCPIGLRKRLLNDRLASGLSDWPPNGLRHSFGSYHLEQFKNAALTALEMGHRDQDLLFRHYRELVSPEAAKAYWSIFPAAEDVSLKAIA
jgi:integrase